MQRIFPDEQTYAEAIFDDASTSVNVKFWRGTEQLSPGRIEPIMVAEVLRDCEIVQPG